jgi:DNA-binding beta-propeller fold protein YncE/tRNA A-37 threonylcarbamoyl transferase component Bud32
MVTEDPASLPHGLGPGSRIAGYLLQEQIGRGGMSVVFLARDERLGRQVALKILAPDLATNRAFRERFGRESRAAAAVDNPHIIPVFEAGEAAGALFIAMRYVPGGDAKSLVRDSGPLPQGRVAEIIAQVASALDAAHRRGLVHRDVKPANILLADSDQVALRDHVYLSDFGLTKGSLEVSGLTAAGQFLGTLNYVSPEQISGRPTDGRADQYALACSAFELLTGQPPFARDEPTAVMYAQLNDQPPAVTSLRPDLSPGLNAVLARALAKSPQDRYASCAEFAIALRAAADPWPASEQPPAADWATKLVPAAPAGPAASATAATSGPPAPPAGTSGPSAGAVVQAGRSRRSAALVLAGAVIVAAGLGGGAAVWALRPAHPAKRGAAPTTAQQEGGSLAAPPCSTDVGPGRTYRLRPAGVLSVAVPPYGAVVTGDLSHTFVALRQAIAVFRDRAGVPVGLPVRTIAVPDRPHAQALTSDGRYLVTATNHGATVIDVAAAQGHGRAIVGQLRSGLPGNPGGDDLALTPDDHLVFEAMRWVNKIAVFDLARALRSGFGPADLIGYIRTGVKPHGMLVSADGRWLYVASRFARPGTLEGSLSVFSVRTATTAPARSFVSSAIAGCGAYRVIASPDGSVLWVLAQSSNELVGLSAVRLRTDPGHAIIAEVRIGPTPLDEVLVNGGTRLLVTDNAGASVAVVNPAAALARRRHALIGYLQAAALPRFFAYVPGAPDVLIVNGGQARQIQAITADDLP